MEVTIFDLIAQLPLVQNLGLTPEWLNACATNVLMILAAIKPRFPSIDTWQEESALVAVVTLGIAGFTFYQNPWAIPVSVLVVWFATTFLTKTGASVVTKGADAIKENRFRNGGEKPTDGESS